MIVKERSETSLKEALRSVRVWEVKESEGSPMQCSWLRVDMVRRDFDWRMGISLERQRIIRPRSRRCGGAR
jgi:hypothetical protein